MNSEDLVRTAVVGGLAYASIRALDRSYKKTKRPIKVNRGLMIGRLGRQW